MELIADILLVAGALGAGLYCFILARRLKRFTDLERGVGGAVSVLSAQAEELRKSLNAARTASDQSGQKLQDLTERAEAVAQRLELIMASMHDVMPEQKPSVPEPAAQPAVAEDSEKVEPKAADEISAEVPAAEQEQAAGAESDEVKPENESAAIPKGLLFFRHAKQQEEARK